MTTGGAVAGLWPRIASETSKKSHSGNLSFLVLLRLSLINPRRACAQRGLL